MIDEGGSDYQWKPQNILEDLYTFVQYADPTIGRSVERKKHHMEGRRSSSVNRVDMLMSRVRRMSDGYIKGRVYTGGFIFPEEQEGILVVRSIADADKLDSAKETDIVYIDLENIFQECKGLMEKSGSSV